MNVKIRLFAPLLMATVTASAALAILPATAVAAEQMYQIGFEQAAIPDTDQAPIAAIIWYPTTAEARDVHVGPVAIKATPSAPVARSRLPMVIISHGTGAGSISHIDTAIALARAGFVVVTPTHSGDNYQDESNVGKSAWLADRSRHVVRTIDFMLGNWREGSNIDKDKIGIFGFSAGATTALVAIGGDARGFGLTMWGGAPVTPETRFQAGSISKSVSAIGALRLVGRGALTLDGDVQRHMKGWSYDKARGPVTLRQLLSHTAGTNLDGMKGYMPGEPHDRQCDN